MQELTALVQYIQKNKAEDQDWFTIKPKDKDGVHWSGSCWSIHELVKYEMPFEFEIPQCYPTTAPEIKIPSMQGKTAKMYRVRPAVIAVIVGCMNHCTPFNLVTLASCRGVQSA